MKITFKSRSISFKWRTCSSSNLFLGTNGVTVGKIHRTEIVTGARRRVVWDCVCLLPAPVVEEQSFYTREEAQAAIESRVLRFFEIAGVA